jgi:hypothetical protein
MTSLIDHLREGDLTMSELLHHTARLGPEILGGGIAYAVHSVHHRLYHAFASILRRVVR